MKKVFLSIFKSYDQYISFRIRHTFFLQIQNSMHKFEACLLVFSSCIQDFSNLKSILKAERLRMRRREIMQIHRKKKSSSARVYTLKTRVFLFLCSALEYLQSIIQVAPTRESSGYCAIPKNKTYKQIDCRSFRLVDTSNQE